MELLRPARPRVKLAVVSACGSAADTIAGTLRLAGLPDQAQAREELEPEPGGRGRTEVPGLARTLVRELDCAVLAMRYPVTDDFAIAFSDALYEHLLTRGHPVDVAAARARAQAAGPTASAARPAVSLATPGVFGARAAGLVLPVPRGQPSLDPGAQKMAHFPDEPGAVCGPDRGDGGRGRRARCRAAAGKPCCCTGWPERERPPARWNWPTGTRTRSPPRRSGRRPPATTSGTQRWRASPPRWRSSSLTTRSSWSGTSERWTRFEAFLPRLRQAMQQHGVLLVLDNLETLLTPDGEWRDPRWRVLIGGLCAPDGESRLVMTSRIAPVAWARG